MRRMVQYGSVCYEYGYLGVWKYGQMHNRLESHQLFGLVFLLNDYCHENLYCEST